MLIGKLASERERIHSLRSFASIGYRIASQHRLLTGRHAVVVERPDRFRLEAYSPLGLLAVAACDGHELSVYDRRNSTVYRGAASARLIGSYISVPLSPRDVVSVLLGRLPERGFEEGGIVEFDRLRRKFRLHGPTAGGGAQSIWFEPGTLRISAAEIAGPGGGRLLVEFSKYGLVSGVMLPHRIEVEASPGGGGLRIAYRSPAVNDALPVDLFRIPRREGVREIAVAEGLEGAGGRVPVP